MASNPGRVASPPAQSQSPYGIKELGQINTSCSSRLSALRVLELWPAAETGMCLAWGCLDNLTLESDADVVLSLFRVASLARLALMNE